VLQCTMFRAFAFSGPHLEDGPLAPGLAPTAWVDVSCSGDDPGI
jgi:hypothetical protein